MYEQRFPARGFLFNDPRLERHNSGDSSDFAHLDIPEKDPFFTTNSAHVANLSSQDMKDLFEQQRKETEVFKRSYMKELPKNDS